MNTIIGIVPAKIHTGDDPFPEHTRHQTVRWFRLVFAGAEPRQVRTPDGRRHNIIAICSVCDEAIFADEDRASERPGNWRHERCGADSELSNPAPGTPPGAN